MGYSCSWFAVREQFAAGFLEHLGLEATGEEEEWPESMIATAPLKGGWHVLWYNEYDCPFLRSEALRTLSLKHEILVCQIEEHVMASSAELWSAGVRQWRVSHEGESGPKGLNWDGQLPDGFVAIKAQMEKEQLDAGGDAADVDYIFEIPPLVARSIAGFKHDEGCDFLDGHQFRVLHRTKAAKNFWARLFRR
jgi:hypothetical protein